MFTITIMGSISGQTAFSAETVETLLAGKRTPLRLGSDFVGRPVTAVFFDDAAVAKLHTEFDWSQSVMEKWVRKALDRERELAVHHPQKTWYLALRHEDRRTLIGNICPTLKPLNQLLASPPSGPEETGLRLSWFEALFRMYFRLGREKAARLDEGVSNFGLDATGTLYYLDDDIYQWDDFLTLSHVAGTWFRTHAWMDADFGMRLGQTLHAILSTDPSGLDYARVAAEHARGLYMPQPGQREALTAFAVGLVQGGGNPPAKRPTRAIPSPTEQRYLALLGDIHANLPALEAVLEFLRGQGISQGLVLGDVVGYGPHPSECIDRIAESDFFVLKGNHDHGAVTGNLSKGFSQLAKWCLEWTIPLLSTTQKAWLKDLPLSLQHEDWLAVHGAPIDPGCFNGYVYVMTYEDNLDNLAQRGIRLCFHGHSHVPAVYARLQNARSDCFFDREQTLGTYRQALICPGSVGQPRDRQVGAQVAVWDRSEGKVSFITLPYDVESTVAAMRDAGFPDSLCRRLSIGI